MIGLSCVLILLTGILLQQTMRSVQIDEIEDILYIFDN